MRECFAYVLFHAAQRCLDRDSLHFRGFCPVAASPAGNDPGIGWPLERLETTKTAPLNLSCMLAIIATVSNSTAPARMRFGFLPLPRNIGEGDSFEDIYTSEETHEVAFPLHLPQLCLDHTQLKQTNPTLRILIHSYYCFFKENITVFTSL